jgi:hypothetical protein
LAGAFVLVGGLVGLLPFQTRAAQNDTFVESQARLEKLQQENKVLTAQRDLLETDEEVARIAREEFGLAPNDATVYAIPDLRPENGDRARGSSVATPQPEPPATAPKRGLGSRLMNFLVFWD